MKFEKEIKELFREVFTPASITDEEFEEGLQKGLKDSGISLEELSADFVELEKEGLTIEQSLLILKPLLKLMMKPRMDRHKKITDACDTIISEIKNQTI